MDVVESMLSTVDNPFNPFTEYEEWRVFDEAHGYYTSQFLARIVKSSDELSDPDQSVAIENAITEIVEENVLGLYIRVTAPTE